MAAAFTFLQSATDTANLSTYSWASQNFGTPSADRLIVACFGTRSTTAGLVVNSVTIGGVSAAVAVQQRNQSSANCVACIAVAAVPTGTSGTIEVVLNGTALRAGVDLFLLTGANATPTATYSSVANPEPTADMDISADGLAIAYAVSGGSGSTVWSGLTERSDYTVESNMHNSSAADVFGSTQTALTVAGNISGFDPVGVFAAFGPAGGGGSSIPVAFNHYQKLRRA